MDCIEIFNPKKRSKPPNTEMKIGINFRKVTYGYAVLVKELAKHW
jgi:hypothetical protein